MTLKEKISKRSKNGRDFTGILVECFDCKKELYRQPAFVKRSKSGKFFCTRECRQNSMKLLRKDYTAWNKGKRGLQTAWNKGITVFFGESHPNWKGGRRERKNWYVVLWTGNKKSKLEHRIVMEKFLGRELENGEVVHHINGDKSDNRIENLQLFESNSAHLKHHMSLKRAGL